MRLSQNGKRNGEAEKVRKKKMKEDRETRSRDNSRVSLHWLEKVQKMQWESTEMH